jgi:hypothetical protein
MSEYVLRFIAQVTAEGTEKIAGFETFEEALGTGKEMIKACCL